MKTDLEIYREEIDIIDKVIAESFEKRMEIVLKVAEYKRKNNLNTFDPSREQKMIEKNQLYIKDEKLRKYYVELLKKQLEVSKLYQEDLKKVLKNKNWYDKIIYGGIFYDRYSKILS